MRHPFQSQPRGHGPSSVRPRAALVALLFLAPVLVGCGSTRNFSDLSVVPSYSSEPPADAHLAQAAARIQRELDTEESGYLPLPRNEDALLWRLALADLAEHTLDAQYFIWHDDASGNLLVDRLLRAADRGVRVRLLIDDIELSGSDKGIAALNQHPNLEVRVFNPWPSGSSSLARGFDFMLHMKRLNQRMHNKLIVADNRLSIVGGRNIGNEYFGLADKFNFFDLDVLAVGPVAPEVSAAFDLYWNNEEAVPGEAFASKKQNRDLLGKLRPEISEQIADSATLLQQFPLEPQEWNEELDSLGDLMYPGPGSVVVDEPDLGSDVAGRTAETLGSLARDAQKEVIIISAYFVPEADFYDSVRELVERGVTVKVLTNSLASNNHSVAHSGYKPKRKRVLEAGAQLYELRADADIQHKADTPPTVARYVGLHTKAIVIDRHKVFIGSLNFDPRSIYLNSEMGMLIDEPELGEVVASRFDEYMSGANAWRVGLDERGKLYWESSSGVLHRQPARSPMERFSAWFFGLLPLDRQL